VRWPGQGPAGSVTDEVAASIDLLPTIAEITGAKLPEHPIDGLSILATLKDPKAASPHRKAGYFYYKNNRVEAVRLGKWKLRIAGNRRRPPRKKGAANPGKAAAAAAPKNVELYDLDADIGESNNVAEKQPEVAAKLLKLARQYDADLKASLRPLWRAGQAKK